MTRIVYPAAMSLDGFIAGPGGDMSWLAAYFGPNPDGDELMQRAGALLVGRRTYDGDDPNKGTDKEGAYGGRWEGTQVVLTHRPPAEPVAGCVFATDLDEAVRVAREAAGERDVQVLGADVARQCLRRGLVDEVVMAVVPVLLGSGVRMFEDADDDTPVALRPTRVSRADTATNLWFDVVR
ncbi:dihydrofolate reductase family protein [Luteipulveratus flavus]|uniref:Dihydrofolate reductase family protein n=1 Tax=Luteipulveratus flavus TaxID=3031728 RepID=A0ABT6C468_9MICO|nr:dihydrofolate reductase family protein [Luteipulveratus sp. YIM 133296]MDF8263067.1 dihydrofolate reductase family protein [Luteipulveratus sp. YIM 133296]